MKITKTDKSVTATAENEREARLIASVVQAFLTDCKQSLLWTIELSYQEFQKVEFHLTN